MKRLKLFLILIISMFLIPSITKAFTSLETSSPSPVVGTEVYIQMNINYLNPDKTNPGIRDYRVIMEYDPSFLEPLEVIWVQGENEAKMDYGRITFIKNNNGRDWNAYITPVMVKFLVKKAGLTNIDLKRDGESHYSDGNIIAQSFSGVSINCTEPSTNTTLGTLYVEGYKNAISPVFSKHVHTYYLTVEPDVTSVKIVAQSNDKRQTITGAGEVQLEYGLNKKRVVVAAQDGSTNVYEIQITRKDDRTGDTSLRSIQVSNTNIKLVEGQTDYEAVVSRSVDNVLIAARTTDPKATMTGTGRKNLEIGDNYYTITVTSSFDSKTEYHVKITRSTEEIQTVVSSTNLATLKVNNIGIDLSNGKEVFLFGVPNDVHDIDIETISESSTATVEVTGNKDLAEGINSIQIHVTEQDESFKDYYVVVYRNPDNTTALTDLFKINAPGDILYTNSESADHLVPNVAVKHLKKGNKLYYNVVNTYNGLLYQAIINGDNIETDTVDASFKMVSESPLTYETSLPKDTKITLYVGDLYRNDTSLKVYSINSDNKYVLITDGIAVVNGYINFELNGDTKYVVSLQALIAKKSPLKEIFNNYKQIIISGLVILVVIIILARLFNKNAKIKESKEPLY